MLGVFFTKYMARYGAVTRVDYSFDDVFMIKAFTAARCSKKCNL